MTRLNNSKIYLSAPHMTGRELEYIKEAFKSNFIAPVGPMISSFENDICAFSGRKYALALSSGTAAMHLALKACKVDPGGDFIASALTFIGGISPIIFMGGTPIFIDSEKTSWNMDPQLLANELSRCDDNGKLPKAVIPTDIYGQCCKLDKIVEICNEYEIPVICDSAEALGANYFTAVKTEDKILENFRKEHRICNKKIVNNKCNLKAEVRHAGKDAAVAIYSFNGNKIITTSGGGMLVSDDKDMVDYARYLSQQARENLPYYEHLEIGFNYRMSNILAAIGRAQLESINDKINKKRAIFEYYKNALETIPGIDFMPEPDWSKSNKWLTVILVSPEEFGSDREEIRHALDLQNIESRPVWKPMHLQPVFNIESGYVKNQTSPNMKSRKYSARVVGGSVSEDLFARGLCLPSGTGLSKSDLNRVIEAIMKCQKK